MDRYFNLFIKNFVADGVRAHVYRGGGIVRVSLGKSRSPEGQYEDLNLSSLGVVL
jgi:hypothetical protein